MATTATRSRSAAVTMQGRRRATRPWCPLPKEVAAKAQVPGNGGQGHMPQPKEVAAKAQVPGNGGQGHVPQPKTKAQVLDVAGAYLHGVPLSAEEGGRD